MEVGRSNSNFVGVDQFISEQGVRKVVKCIFGL